MAHGIVTKRVKPLWCRTCKQHKPAAEFPGVVANRCRACNRARARRQAPVEAPRPSKWGRGRVVGVGLVTDARHLWTYPPSRAQWQHVFDGQGQVCAICGALAPGRRGWASDHDHATDMFRGVLCVLCNIGLGYFGDNPARLRDAANYLENALLTAAGE